MRHIVVHLEDSFLILLLIFSKWRYIMLTKIQYRRPLTCDAIGSGEGVSGREHCNLNPPLQ